jgi:hypothetical protein
MESFVEWQLHDGKHEPGPKASKCQIQAGKH